MECCRTNQRRYKIGVVAQVGVIDRVEYFYTVCNKINRYNFKELVWIAGDFYDAVINKIEERNKNKELVPIHAIKMQKKRRRASESFKVVLKPLAVPDGPLAE